MTTKLTFKRDLCKTHRINFPHPGPFDINHPEENESILKRSGEIKIGKVCANSRNIGNISLHIAR